MSCSNPKAPPLRAARCRIVADLRTDGDRYVLEVELPGVEPADVQVYALGDALVIEGQKRPNLPPDIRPAYDRAERDYGPFRRVFDLPGPRRSVEDRGLACARACLCIRVPRIVDRRGRPRPIKVQLVDDDDREAR